MARILVIDDDELIAYALKRACLRLGHEVRVMTSVREVSGMTSSSFDVVFLDISLPDGNGLTLLPHLLTGDEHPELIVITGHDNPQWIEQALTAGAWDYIRKDDSLETILAALEQALLFHQKRCGTPHGRACSLVRGLKRDKVVGVSSAISRCVEVAGTCADSDICVLLTGETGTGKEVFARTIHENSPRGDGPFVVVDCAALPENLAESILFGHVRGAFTGAATRETGLILEADKGTLFLDEIGELPLSLQKIFLRVLQEKRLRPVGSAQEIVCDFRLLAATNKNLEVMVEEKTFREDLFYRVQAAHIHLPPLRERREDIPALARHFCTHFCQLYGFPPKQFVPNAESVLAQYDWPGNVRELCGAVEHAVITAGLDTGIVSQYLPTRIRIHAARQRVADMDTAAARPVENTHENPSHGEVPSYAAFRKQVWLEEEGRYLTRVLMQTEGDIAQACRVTGLSRSRLYSLLKRHNLTRQCRPELQDSAPPCCPEKQDFPSDM